LRCGRPTAARGAGVLLAAAALLAGCGSPDDAAPAGATGNEQRALAEAAEMLDDRPAPVAAEPAPSPAPSAAATAR